MSHGLRKTLALLLCLIFCMTLIPPVWAREVVDEERVALGSEGEDSPASEETTEADGYARLLAAIQNKETNVNLDGMGTVTIHNDLTIPADMFVSAWGGTIIEVPEGVALNVNGELHADGFILDGTLNVGEHTFVNMGGIQRLYNGHPLGTLNVGRGSSVDMRGECYNGVISEYIDGNQLPSWVNNNIVEGGRVLVSYDAWNEDGLSWAYEQATSLAESFVGRVNVYYDAVIGGNLDPNRDGTELYVDGAWGNEGALTIAEGSTVSARYTCIQNATLTVNGKLINNDRIDLRAEQDGENGTLLPRLIVNGELIGPGMFYVYGVDDEQTARGCIQGLGELNGYWDGDAWVFYSGDSLRGALEAACEDPNTDYINLSNLGELTIENSITIPKKLYVEAEGTILTVPNGVTVTVQGRVKTRAFDIREGGTVIMDGGRLDLRDTQIGDFKINGALELNNTTVEIPAPIWGKLSDAEKGNITFSGDNAVVRAMFEPTADDIAATFNEANLTMEQHVMPVIDVNIPITLPDNITVNQGVRLKAHQDITVPAGITLTLNSRASMQDDSRLIVYGTLANNAFLEFTHTENAANNPRLIIKTEEGGAYTGGGFLGPQEHDDPDAYFSGVDLSAYSRVMDENGTRYMPSEIFYNDLKRACESENPPQNMDLKNLGTITIEDDLTIPAGMRVGAGGTKILVPDGVTLTVKGILNAGELEIKGVGSVVFDNEAFVVLRAEPSAIGSPIIRGTDSSLTVNHPHELTVMYPASDLESLRTAAQNASAEDTANVDNNVQVKSPITVPEGTVIPLTGANLMIEKGGKLTLNGTITADNAFIAVNDDGRLENNGSISMSFGEDFFMPKLFINGGEYAGGGSVTFYDNENHIDGINLDAFTVTQLTEPDRWIYSLNTDFAYQEILRVAAMSDDEWKAAGYPDVEIADMGDVRINSNTAIPSHLFVNADHDRIIVPQGVELIIEGGLNTGDLIIEAGGKVTVYGYLEVNNQITGDGELVINGTWVELKAAGAKSLNLENISLDNAGFRVRYYVENDNEFIKAMNEIQNTEWPRGVMQPVLMAGYNVEAGGDLSVPVYMELDITDGKTLTLLPDTTLTVDGVLRATNDAKIFVNGTLVNNGTVDTEARNDPEDTSPRLIFGETAVYEGRGYLGVMDTKDPESYISGLDVSGFQTLKDNVGIRYYQVGDVWGELQAAIDNGESYYYMGNLGELTMPSDFTLPANFNIETWGTTIIVPDGKTLTIAPNAHIGIHNLVVETGGTVVVSDDGYLNTYTSLVLNGSMTAGNNARLHLAAPQTGDTSFIENIELTGYVRGATVHFYPTTEAELLNAKTAGDALEGPYYGNIHVRFPWTLSSAIAFDGNTDLEIETSGGYTGSLTIANGGELTLNRYTQVRSSDLTVKAGGKLINNAELVIRNSDRFPTGTLSREEGGSYEGDGVIRVYGTSEAEAPNHITGIDNLISLRTEHDGEECTEFRPDAFLRLKKAVADEEKICDLKGVGYVRIAENFEIPDWMKVEAWDGTVIDVPEGITLTVNGQIVSDGLILDGSVVMGEGADFDFGHLHDIENTNGRPRGVIRLAEDATVSTRQDNNDFGINPYLVDKWVFTEDESTRFAIEYYDTWTEDGIRRAVYDAQQLPDVAYGSVRLVNDQTLRDFDLAEPRFVCLELSGHWDENGWHNNSLTLEGNTRTDYLRVNGGELYIKDRFENVDRIELHTEQGVDPHLSFVDNPEIIGELNIYVYDAETEDAARARVEGIDGLTCDWDEESGAWFITKDVFAAFKAACEDGETTYFDLTDLGKFVIKESVTIPERMRIDTWGTTFVVPEGVEFGIEHNDTWFDGIFLNGTINVGNDIFVGLNTLHDIKDGRPAGILNVGTNSSVDMQGIGYDGENEVLLDAAQLPAWARKADNGGRILLSYDARNDTEFADRYERADALERPYVGRVCVAYEMILEDNLNARKDDVELAIVKRWDGENGSLTIPAGKTLTVGCMNMAGGTLTVNGTLANTDRIDLNKGDNNAMPGILVNEGGKFICAGRIYVHDVDTEDAAKACVTGVKSLECQQEDDAWVLYSNNGAFESLKAACADESMEYIDLRNLGRLVIEEDLTIPERLNVDTWGTIVVVPEGVEFDVEHDGTWFEGLVLNGTLNVGDGIFVHISTLHDISNGRPAGSLNVGANAGMQIQGVGLDADDKPVYLDSAKLTQWARKLDDIGGIVLSYDAWNDTDFATIYSLAAVLTYPYSSMINVNYPMTLEKDLSTSDPRMDLLVNAYSPLNQNGSITIEEGVTLSSAYMSFGGGTLTINGTLINNDRIELWPDDQGNTARITVGEGGKFIGAYRIYVHEVSSEQAARACVTGVKSLECRQEGDVWVLYSNSGAFEALKAACEDESTKYISLTDLGRLVIEEDLTIPERLNVDAWGTVIDIPADVTLTVNRDFYPDGFLLNGTLNVGDETDVGMQTLYGVTDGRPAGTLNVGYHCHVNIQGVGVGTDDKPAYLDSAKLPQWAHKNGERGRINLEYAADNTDFADVYSLAAAPYKVSDAYGGRVRIIGQVTLTQDINAYADKVDIEVNGWENPNASLTINNGVTLNAQYMGVSGTALIVNGTLINNDRIDLHPANEGMATITVGENGKLIGSGEIDVSAETPEEANGYLSGITNLSEGVWSEDRKQFVYHTEDDPFELLALACEQELDSIDLREYESVTIRENIIIPATLGVRARNIIIPDGVTLTVNGYLKATGLTIPQTGKVIVNGGYLGIFDGNPDMLVINGSLELRNTWMEIQAFYWLNNGLDDTEKAKISYQDNAGINVVFFRDGSGAEDAIAQASQMPAEHVHAIVNIDYDFTMTDDLTIPEGVVVTANNRFTVSTGKTLTVNGTLNIRESGVVDVLGTLVNNSFIEYKPASAGATGVRFILEDGAVYTGPGFIGITLPAVPESCIDGLDLKKDFVRWDDDRGSRFLLRPVIDLKLPAMLTEIESEAFAGGAFSSVYIPATVTVIAENAFGDMQGLTIYGTTDTARSFATSEYAQAHGYTFVEYDAAA